MKILPISLALLCIFCLVTGFTFAQSSISGKLADAEGKSVEFATVTLFSADSTLVQAGLSDIEGVFEFKNLKNGSYYVTASSVGFESIRSKGIQFNASESRKDIGVLVMKTAENNLQEIQVIGQKSLVEMKQDRIVFNVENSIFSDGNTALELLEKAPGVTVDQDGAIALKGKEGVKVMLNGRLSYLSQSELATLLKATPSNTISQIEVITNPSSKYDAAGNSGMLNIVMKENKDSGLNGSVNANAARGRAGRYGAGMSLNYRKDNWNVFATYNHSQRTEIEFREDMRRFRSNGVVNRYSDQRTEATINPLSHNFKLGADYQLGKKDILGVMVDGNIGNSDNDLTTSNRLIDFTSGTTLLDAKTASTDGSKWNSLSYNINYTHKFDDQGRELSADVNYATNGFDANQRMETRYYNANGESSRPMSGRNGVIPSYTDVYVAKVDYVHPLNGKAKMETGWKGSYVQVDNNLKYDTLSGNDWVKDAGTTNHFIYKEQIQAGYLNYSNEWGKLSLMAGLRLEYTETEGHQVTTDSLVKRSYLKLFPSLFSTYQLNDSHTMQLSYSRRIGRPDYNDLNPFRIYRDPYQYHGGNPFLKPQLSHSFEISHNFKGIIITSIEYNYTGDAINWLMQQVDSLNLTVSTRENLKSRTYIGASVSANLNPTSWWTVNSFLNVFKSRFVGGENIAVKSVDNSQVSFYGNLSNSFKIVKDFSAEYSLNYTSPTVYGVYRNRSVFVMSAGLQKKVLQGKGSLKLTVNDILQGRQRRNSARFDNLDFTGRVRFDSRVANLSFSYSFGKKLSPARKRQSGSEDIENRVKREL